MVQHSSTRVPPCQGHPCPSDKEKKLTVCTGTVQGPVSDETGRRGVQDVKASHSFLALLLLLPQIQSFFFTSTISVA